MSGGECPTQEGGMTRSMETEEGEPVGQGRLSGVILRELQVQHTGVHSNPSNQDRG